MQALELHTELTLILRITPHGTIAWQGKILTI
jgi:hypothetical protein